MLKSLRLNQHRWSRKNRSCPKKYCRRAPTCRQTRLANSIWQSNSFLDSLFWI